MTTGPRRRGLLDLVEWIGNKLPEPATLFLIGTIILVLIGIRFSSVAGGRPTSPPRNTDSLS
jgi:p-aminobenzoyl-glutamate transporter AbgT